MAILTPWEEVRYSDNYWGVEPLTLKWDGPILGHVVDKKRHNKPATYRQYDKLFKKVIFNDPATIVYWSDGTKTVVKAENEEFDPEKGLAMAISKKMLGNEGNYYEIFKKYIPEESCDLSE